eukprot:782982-Pleurochrysis_carterae.AAC.1
MQATQSTAGTCSQQVPAKARHRMTTRRPALRCPGPSARTPQPCANAEDSAHETLWLDAETRRGAHACVSWCTRLRLDALETQACAPRVVATSERPQTWVQCFVKSAEDKAHSRGRGDASGRRKSKRVDGSRWRAVFWFSG